MPPIVARRLAISFFAATVLLAETLFFHVTNFVLGYCPAMTVIGCTVAGIGVGAFLAQRQQLSRRDTFALCCIGTTVFLYVAALVLLRYPTLPALLMATAAIFVFPSMYIADAFSRDKVAVVYLFDMLGAGIAVVIFVFATEQLGSEQLFLSLTTILPLAGLLWSSAVSYRGSALRWRACLASGLLVCIGGGLAYHHQSSGALNVARLVNPNAGSLPEQSMLRRESRLQIAKTYDSLAGRLDVIPGTERTFVTYNGFFNDNFRSGEAADYLEYAKPHRIEYPARDRRVFYGLVPEPRVFVIGPATTGILKALRTITPVDHIDAVEINSGVLTMMRRDYFEQSGKAYEGLRVQLGNALSALKRSRKKYDIITLINTHSSQWIGAIGPPDYLHTRESYDIYFDHLTDDGYLLFEERPVTRMGELAVRRMILTLYDCLKRRGATDPSQHFFIWEYMSRRFAAEGKTGVEPRNDMYYVGMIVTRAPMRKDQKRLVERWYDRRGAVTDEHGFVIWRDQDQDVYPAYLESTWANARFGPFFKMIEEGDFSKMDEGFDASIVTNDRPYPSVALTKADEVAAVLKTITAISIALCALFAFTAIRRQSRKRQVAALLGYNLAIGFAYFLVEVMLIQACHSVFLSPSASLILVLAVLLVGSGCGGMLAGRVSLLAVTGLLTALLLVGVGVPDRMLAGGCRPSLVTGTAVATVFAIGLLMGVFFPAGLQLADRCSMRHKIPHLFAINSVAGSLATVVALYLGIRVGYRWTVLLAVLLYGSAAWIYLRQAHARPKSPLLAGAGSQPPTGEQPERSPQAAVPQVPWSCGISTLPPLPTNSKNR